MNSKFINPFFISANGSYAIRSNVDLNNKGYMPIEIIGNVLDENKCKDWLIDLIIGKRQFNGIELNLENFPFKVFVPEILKINNGEIFIKHLGRDYFNCLFYGDNRKLKAIIKSMVYNDDKFILEKKMNVLVTCKCYIDYKNYFK